MRRKLTEQERYADKESYRKRVNLIDNLESYYAARGKDLHDVFHAAIGIAMTEKQIKKMLRYADLPEELFDVDYPYPKKEWHEDKCGIRCDKNGVAEHYGYYPRDFKTQGFF